MKRSGLWLIALCTALAGCGDGPALAPHVQERRELPQPGAAHAAHTSEPALAVAPDGTPHLAWIRSDGSRASVETVRVASGEIAPVRVDPRDRPVANGHQPPGLAVGPDGRVHVSWSSPRRDPGGSPFASDLVLATSADGGRHFAAPVRLHEDRPGSRGFEAIAADRHGAVWAAWIESGGGAGALTRVVRVADGVRGEVASLGERTCPCCRITVATDPAGRVGVLWRDEFPDRVRDMVFALLPGDGRPFAPTARVAEDGWALDACPHRGGALAFEPDGRALAAWYSEGDRGEPALWLADGDGGGFAAPRALHEPGGGSLPDRVALAVGPDGDGIVLWERRTPVRSEIAARAVLAGGRRLGPTRVLSIGVHASGPAVVAARGGFVAAWNEEEFPVSRTVLATIALSYRP